MNKNPLVFFCIFCVKAYSYLLSPIIGKNCRFFPTCSEYAIESFRNFGFIKGGWLSIKRILSAILGEILVMTCFKKNLKIKKYQSCITKI